MSKVPEIGDKAPNVCLENQDSKEVCLKDLKGKWVVLYFYPKDMTSGCTKEAIGFSESKNEFDKLGAEIFGVSPDPVDRHCKFIEKHDLTINLLADIDKISLKDYGVWQKKKMYGREFDGVVRSTFLIDPKGVVREKWTKVKVNGHVEAVKEKLKELKD